MKKQMKVSFIINIIILIMTVNAIIMSVMGINFMYGYEPSSDLTGVPMYSYFTVQSNIFMGIISFIFANREYQIMKGKKKDIPFIYYIIKFIGTVSVSLTFFVVFGYLGFVSKGAHIPLLRNSNLFFHLIIPLISIINFLFFEKTDKIKFRHTFFGILPTALYEVYYVINIVINMKHGNVTPSTDWYYLTQNGIFMPLIVAPAMIAITYLISLIIWRLNKKVVHKKRIV